MFFLFVGVSDAECCVSGAFFRTFPRIVLYPMESEAPDRSLSHRFASFLYSLPLAPKHIGNAIRPSSLASTVNLGGPPSLATRLCADGVAGEPAEGQDNGEALPAINLNLCPSTELVVPANQDVALGVTGQNAEGVRP